MAVMKADPMSVRSRKRRDVVERAQVAAVLLGAHR